MSTTVVNGAPMTVFYGTNDQSTRQLQREPEARPTHLPMFWTYAKKGRDTEVFFVVGDSLTQTFDAETFNLRGVYATHVTELLNRVNAQGNICAVKRVKPDDAPGPATLRIYMDVLATKVPEYTRNSDGTYEIDSFGNKTPTGSTIDGYQVKFTIGQADSDFGTATQVTGDQTDSDTSTTSKRYPIIDVEVDNFGDWGNNVGLRLWAATQNSTNPVDDRLIANTKIYPFRMSVIQRADALSIGQTVATQAGEQYMDFTFKPGVINPYTDRDMYLGDILVKAYQDTQTVGSPPIYGPFGRMKIYDNYVTEIINEFYTAEKPYIDEFSDLNGEDTDEQYRFNFISGLNSSGAPYHSFVFNNEDSNAVVLTENSTSYAAGGGDGTMNETAFAALVKTDALNLADPNHAYQNMSKYPFSHFYDTGYPLETKYSLASALAIRKDTFVVLSTYDVNGTELTAADESSIAIALRTRLQMYPESEYFGTSTMRGMVVPRYGDLIGSQYRKKLPLTVEVGVKSAKYMGAASRQWDSRENLEGDPGNRVDLFTNINNTYTPATVRNKDWDNGLVAVLDYDRSSAFFPAYKTVYDNDTSVLNSYITACAVAELEKVGYEVWKELSGRSDLSEIQLIKEVNDRFNAKTTNLFAGRYVITPNAYFTADDRARGYSWTTEVTIYAPTMYTVQKLIITSRRMSDLEENQ